MKELLVQKLIANVIRDQCARKDHLIFREAWCSQERTIRFTTSFWQKLRGEGAVLYEAENKLNSFVVNCVCKKDGNIIQSWDLTNADPNAIFAAFDELISKTIPAFERQLEAQLKGDFVEGEQKMVFTTKYERNSQARAACLAYHGYTCKLCGMSFEQTYGPDFKEIIEVHHIVPLHQIGEAYVVDPIHDLIPVCPNCHAAIHSKHGTCRFADRFIGQ
ncbi:MAG: HNH endonuclease [Clostridia bacterium]|nr:HNH endonuclease [Clostridia bacterium]